MAPVLTVYLGGVLLGLWKVDGPVGERIAVAALWPVGVLAFAVTISLLLAAAAVRFPLAGALAAAALVGWLLLR